MEYVATLLPRINDNFFRVRKYDDKTAKFTNLAGGLKEYIFTVSAIVNNAKMKGDTFRTYLPPFPPQKLNVDLQEAPTCHTGPSTNLTSLISFLYILLSYIWLLGGSIF